MSLKSRLSAAWSALLGAGEPRSTASFPAGDPAAAKLFGVGQNQTAAGIDIDEDTALRFSAVYAAIRVISETVGMLPLKVMERTGNGDEDKRTSNTHWVSGLLANPNDEQTPMVMRETLMAAVVGHGNSISELTVNGRGQVDAIYPIDPQFHRKPTRVDVGGRTRLQYSIPTRNNNDGMTGGFKQVDQSMILHVPALSFDGTWAKSPIRLHREAIALGLAAQIDRGGFYGRGSRASGVIQLPEGKKLTPDARKDLRTQFERAHAGVDSSYRTIVLDDGKQWQQTTIPAGDAETVATMKWGITEIARIYRLAPVKLQDLDRAIFRNVEQQSLSFVTDSILPWLVRFEQELNRKLFLRRERGRFFVEHLVEGLLRGDIKTRFDAYRVAWMNGWMNTNEIRRRENLPPIDGGGEHWVPQNMAPMRQIIASLDNGDGGGSGDSGDNAGESGDGDGGESNGDSGAAGDLGANETLRLLAVERIRPLVNRECRQLRRAASNPRGFPGWIETFYESHRERMVDRLKPIAATAGMDAETTDDVVKSYVDESRSRLDAAQDTPVGEFEAAINAIADEWQADRPSELANQLLGNHGDTESTETE